MGAPPLIIISFLNETVDATPGSDCITLEISLFPPGFLKISVALMFLLLTGLSSDLPKGEALISTSSSDVEDSVSFALIMVGLFEFTMISEAVYVSNPINEKLILYTPGFMFSM